jgi:hydrogenase nickel incorporation protein HypA/HybF
MHELSVALSILDLVEEEATRQDATRILEIHLKLGPLSGVVKEALRSAFVLARAGTPSAEARLVIEETPVRVHCPACRAMRGVVSVQELCCAACGAPAAEVLSGRDLEVVAMEIE